MDERITQAVFSALDIVNQQLPKDEQIEKKQDAALFYTSGGLDSLGIINLVMAIEERIRQDFGVNITLADEKALSSEDSPFRTVGTLINYISSLLNENAK